MGLEVLRNVKLGYTALSPGPFSTPVSIMPSLMIKMPGKRFSQGWLAAGQYWGELASMAATPGA